ncbi:ubiquitin-like protein 7 [Parus major]|uniref:ubiquitin-like protein 7 n=1 Tax=Parus major TaxID=9157 RepID=UPI000771249B|nr:ubiquitin-like protein 7 [Parus major]
MALPEWHIAVKLAEQPLAPKSILRLPETELGECPLGGCSISHLKQLITGKLQESMPDPELIDLIYCGRKLRDDQTLDFYGIQSGSTVHVLRKSWPEPDQKPEPVDKVAAVREFRVLHTALHSSPAYRDAVFKMLGNKESLDQIIVATPGLSSDPVALGESNCDPEELRKGLIPDGGRDRPKSRLDSWQGEGRVKKKPLIFDPFVERTKASSRVDPEGSEVSSRVDPEGSEVSSRVDPEGSEASSRVDPEGSEASSRVDPEGSKASSSVDPEGVPGCLEEFVPGSRGSAGGGCAPSPSGQVPAFPCALLQLCPSVSRLIPAHPALVNAIVLVLHSVAGSTALPAPDTSSRAMALGSYRDMPGGFLFEGLSDDEDDFHQSTRSTPSSSASSSRPASLGYAGAAGPRPITQSELATALALASTPESSSHTPTPGTQGHSSGTSPMSSSVQSGTPITNDLFSQALQHALQASGQPSLQSQWQPQLQQLRDMGIHDDELSLRALQATGGDIQAALELIFAGGAP